MAILAAAGRIAGTLASMAATRVELAAVEVQQEARRLLGALAWAVLAACLAAGAVLFAALFVILLCWDTWRLQAVAAMAVLLGLAATVVLMRVRAALDARPALLSDTMTALRHDLAFVRAAAAADEAMLQETVHD
jgi:uncharacterized membrane protein YqjE